MANIKKIRIISNMFANWVWLQSQTLAGFDRIFCFVWKCFFCYFCLSLHVVIFSLHLFTGKSWCPTRDSRFYFLPRCVAIAIEFFLLSLQLFLVLVISYYSGFRCNTKIFWCTQLIFHVQSNLLIKKTLNKNVNSFEMCSNKNSEQQIWLQN